MSLAQELSSRTLARIVARVGATEILGDDGGALLDVGAADGGPIGTMRIFAAPEVPKIVSTTLAVPARGVVTCMIFAFTPGHSAVPHFTLDCGQRPDGYAFHLDLVPRVELASHLAYMDEVFEPLTSAYESGSATVGLSATGTTRRQVAMMSPWMLVHFADEIAFRAIDAVVDAYADHWCGLVETGVSPAVEPTIADTDLGARDATVRSNLFNPSVDPVWGRVEAMVGVEAARLMREELQGRAN